MGLALEADGDVVEPTLVEDVSLQVYVFLIFFFQAEDGIRDLTVTGVQTCALPISRATRGSLEQDRHRAVPRPGPRPGGVADGLQPRAGQPRALRGAAAGGRHPVCRQIGRASCRERV